MRVLLLSPDMHPREGGPPRVVYGAALALARAGVDVDIAAIGLPGDEAETVAAWPGVSLRIFARGAPRLIGRSPELNRFLRAHGGDYDLLHSHCIWEAGLADAAAVFRALGKPTLISAHGMLDRWQMRRGAWKKALGRRFLGTGAMLDRAFGVVYGSAEEAGEARALGLHSRAVIVPNGVEPGACDGTPAARADLFARVPQLREWRRTVLFFSRLHSKKGIDLLVEAFALLYRDFPGTGLLLAAIAQDEDYEVRIKTRIAELQPIPIVLIADPTGIKPAEAFGVADIFCLPSHQEGFSMAIIEAASAGLPSLITDKCHFPEIAEAGAGLVVPDTVEAIESGLRRLLAMDEAALIAMGAAGKRLIEERYTWDRMAERLLVAYREAVA